MGISVEDLKARLQTKVEQMVGKDEFFRATTLDELKRVMMSGGRWKSQFETGTSQGALDPSVRAERENRMFNYDYSPDRDKENRPIYGYFSDDKHGIINPQGRIPPPASTSGYGSINIKIKRSVALNKATITFHLRPLQNHTLQVLVLEVQSKRFWKAPLGPASPIGENYIQKPNIMGS
ncbi:MAG: hypothetical protein UT32_C0011G0037 [Parcubacteria group bacterium GW2011_GWC2_39_14]|nr:MAG: hypothetical protein UT32_C0011G0037 [Parcubacteria group bacterium GW2011_GWC2_39_14]KKR55073.1 MAG: hypothetical protein UT91_C0005G0074 [Parcubacteria group bacterium GW2011_GWA2_40_23]